MRFSGLYKVTTRRSVGTISRSSWSRFGVRSATLGVEASKASARFGDALDKPKANRVAADREHDRHRGRRRLYRERSRSAKDDYYINTFAFQLLRRSLDTREVPVRVADVEGD